MPLFAFVTLPGSILGLEAGLHSASFDKVDRQVEDHLVVRLDALAHLDT